MSGIRNSDPRKGLVPYNSVAADESGASGGKGPGRDGLLSYNENPRPTAHGDDYAATTTSRRYEGTKGSNDYSQQQQWGSAAGQAQETRHRSQQGAPATGYPVISSGSAGQYVSAPEPVNNWRGSGPQGGLITCTTGSRNQVESNGKTFGTGGGGGYGPSSPQGSGFRDEKHHHHHYYYNQQQQPPVRYEEKKRRRGVAGALAGALVACWACTFCCHAPLCCC